MKVHLQNRSDFASVLYVQIQDPSVKASCSMLCIYPVFLRFHRDCYCTSIVLKGENSVFKQVSSAKINSTLEYVQYLL
jgi:hypothetical protein